MRHGTPKDLAFRIDQYLREASALRCGPCHAIAPKFESLAKEYKNVNFVKCDVDAATDVASEYKVTAMCVRCSSLNLGTGGTAVLI